MKYLVCSDIHLGHPRTPTKHIIQSFKTHILSKSNSDIQVLFISGDLFDRLLDLNSIEVHYIIEFFNYLLTYCYTNNIQLRVLEGTPSHDWNQSSILLKLNDIRTNKCDLAYHKELTIEYVSSIQKYVLYIPDEWTSSHQSLELQIKSKLDSLNISNVDIAVLHGQFKYQLAIKSHNAFYFKEEYFLSLVKGYIHIGHYHMFSTLDRIIANGSLERLAHGEESPKGYVIVQDNSYLFKENTDAYTYTTINITKSTTLEKLDATISKYPVDSYIRLLFSSSDHSLAIIYSELKLRYLDYNLKKVLKNQVLEDTTVSYILSDSDLDYSSVHSLEGNIHETLLSTLLSKYSFSDIEKSKLVNYISILNSKETEDA